MIGFLKFLAHFPLSVLYVLAYVLYIIAYYVIGYRKKVVLKNLSTSFPSLTPQEHKIIAKNFYKNLSWVIVESLKSYKISAQELNKRVLMQNESVDLMQGLALKYGGVVAMCGHQANWEWILLKSSLVLQGKLLGIYRPLKNQQFDLLMQKIRGKFGAIPTPEKQVLRNVVKYKNEALYLGMVADQTPGVQGSMVCEFLNQPTFFFKGSEKIAFSTNFPVVFLEMIRLKKGQYELKAHLIAQPNEYSTLQEGEIIKRYAKVLDQSIKSNPSDWLWSHKRWKHAIPKV